MRRDKQIDLSIMGHLQVTHTPELLQEEDQCSYFCRWAARQENQGL